MCLAPGARYDDGEMHVAVIPYRSKFAMVSKTLPKVASGEYVKEPGVLYFSTKRIEVESDPPGLIEIDGDLFGMTPATFTVCPEAVQVLCPDRIAKQVS